MAVDFPASPTVNQIYETPDGFFYQWDGSVWVSLAGPAPETIFFTKEVPAVRTGDHTLAAADVGIPQVFNITTNSTLTLPALSGVQEGSAFWVRNAQTSTAWVVIDGNGTEAINGQTSYLIFIGESAYLMATSTGWLLFGVSDFGWRQVRKQTASSSAQIDFLIPTGFSLYRFELSGVRPATDGAIPIYRTSTDNGSTFDAGVTDYTGLGIVVSTGAGAAPANATSGILSGALDTGVATEHSLATIDFYPGNGTLTPRANVLFSFPSNGTTAMEMQIRSFRRNSTTAVNAVRFLMSTGNISVGDFALLVRK